MMASGLGERRAGWRDAPNLPPGPEPATPVRRPVHSIASVRAQGTMSSRSNGIGLPVASLTPNRSGVS